MTDKDTPTFEGSLCRAPQPWHAGWIFTGWRRKGADPDHEEIWRTPHGGLMVRSWTFPDYEIEEEEVRRDFAPAGCDLGL